MSGRQLSPMVGLIISRLLDKAPHWTWRFAWSENARIGLDPDAARTLCIKWRGKRREVASWEVSQ